MLCANTATNTALTDEMNKVTFILFLVIYHTSYVTLELFYGSTTFYQIDTFCIYHLSYTLSPTMALDTKNSDISYGMLYVY